MRGAIEIVKGMIAEVNGELDEVQVKYSRTNPNSIYDVGYRRILEQMHDRLIAKSIVLEDVAKELERAENLSDGLADKGV